jgi:hypothetical protein
LNNINFYKLDEVQAFMPKYDDEQKQYTGMAINEHILMVGKTGSGKSNTMMNYIYLTSLVKKGTYKKIIMCVKKTEAFSKFLKKKLGDDLLIYNSLATFPSVDQFVDLSEKQKDRFLIIFDDCVNDKSKKDLEKIEAYFTYSRNKGCTCLFLSQSFYQTAIYIRKQVSWVILCGITGKRDLMAILKDYSIGELDKDALQRMYDYCKEVREEGQLNFMKICTYECPLDKKFSRNWLDYLKPLDFTKASGKGIAPLDIVSDDDEELPLPRKRAARK